MIVVLMTHAGDVRQAQCLIQWIARLGKVNAPLLLVADCDTPFDQVLTCQKLAEGAFTDFHAAGNKVATPGWPQGPHSLFKAACENVYKRFTDDFLLLEPDAIPLHPDWFNQIQSKYKLTERPYMGHLYQGTENFVGERFMSGISVYPQDTFSRLSWEHVAPWDVFHRKEFVDNGTHTDLIHHFYGQLDGGVRFIPDAREPQSPREKHLSWIPEGTVLFHRDKTQSLIPLLKKKLFNESGKLIKVVFPVHAGDVGIAIRHAQWLKQLHKTKIQHGAVVSFDRATPITEVATLTNLLRESFADVVQHNYPRAPVPGYPAGANWSFQNAAHCMSHQDHPWFWFEADAVALKASWMDALQMEYEIGARPFMGVVVPHMGHLQGTAVYPPDAAKRLRGAMSASVQAFDMFNKEEIAGEVFDASRILCHVWTLAPGVPRGFHPVGGGELPAGLTVEELKRNVPRDAVFLHRIKDNSVLEHLISGRWTP